MTERPVYLLKIPVRSDGLARFARRRGLPTHSLDEGYAAHMILREIWQEKAPGRFRLRSRSQGSRVMDLWAYSEEAPEQLDEWARTYADPELVSVLDDPHRLSDDGQLFSHRRVPSMRPGARVGFEVRVCPVRRGQRPEGEGTREVDAFLSKCLATDGPVDREEVYRGWLAERLGACEGLELLESHLRAFRLEKVWRRNHESPKRKARALQRPDALMNGVVEIGDPAAFMQLLVRGVGRHRSFGYGMLLLVPRAQLEHA